MPLYTSIHDDLLGAASILVDPGVLGVLVLNDSFGEPESDFVLSGLYSVGSMADVAASDETVVTTDGTDGRSQGVGGPKHGTTSLDCVETLDHKGANRSRGHILDESREEGLVLEVGIVLLKVLSSGMNHLHGHDLVPAVLKATYDLSDEVTLDAIRLDHDEAAFRICRHVSRLVAG